METIRKWIRRYFSDPQALILLGLLACGVAVVFFFGGILAPVFTAIVIAYLLEGVVGFLERRRLNRLTAVIVVFLGFLTFSLFALLTLMPVLSKQITQFLRDLPAMISQLQEALLRLPELYPNMLSEGEIREMISFYRTEIVSFGQRIVSLSVASLVTVLTYVFLVPFLVFFFLKDKRYILSFFKERFTVNHELATSVWREVNHQIGAYLRGKFWEILIVWGFSTSAFALLGLQLPVLIGLLVGLSVLIPYIGAIAMTIPVALMAYFQWGVTAGFVYILVAYAVIQLLDGNLLAPLLVSDSVKLHPITVIVAILFFGGLWGFLGLFFAIPLATLIRAVFQAWPRADFDESAIAAPAGEPGT